MKVSMIICYYQIRNIFIIFMILIIYIYFLYIIFDLKKDKYILLQSIFIRIIERK